MVIETQKRTKDATGRFLAQTILYRILAKFHKSHERKSSAQHTPVSNVHIHTNCIQTVRTESRSVYPRRHCCHGLVSWYLRSHKRYQWERLSMRPRTARREWRDVRRRAVPRGDCIPRGASRRAKTHTHPPWRVRHTVGKGSRPQAKHSHPRAAAAEASHYAALIPE
jgi:hypothetical protein